MGSQQQQFCLRWNNHQPNMLSIFDKLLSKEAFVDVTIACEGSSIKAHKMVLSACSPFFEDIFTENPCKHPIVIMKDIKHSDLKDIIKFMYKGEINVSQDRLSGLLKTAESLKVKGLADVNHDEKNNSGKSSDSLMVRGQVDLPPIPTHQSSFGNNSPASRSSLLNHLSSSNTSSSNKRKNRPQRNVNDSDVYSQQPIAKKRSESPKITEAIKIKQSSSPKPADRLDSSNSEAQMSLLTAASSSVRSGSNQSQVPTSTLGMILSGKENNIRIKSENSSLEEICTSDSVNESESSVTQEYILEPETLLDQTGISTGNNEDSYQDGDQSELIIGSSDLDIAGEQNRDAGPSQDSSVIFQDASSQVKAQTASIGIYNFKSTTKTANRAKTWQEEDMKQAITMITAGGWDIKRTAETYSIPLRTLYYHLKKVRGSTYCTNINNNNNNNNNNVSIHSKDFYFTPTEMENSDKIKLKEDVLYSGK